MCPSAARVCSEPGGQKPVLSLSLDLINPQMISVTGVYNVECTGLHHGGPLQK